MSIQISAELLAQICAHGEAAYPDEGAGFILGSVKGEVRVATQVLPAGNAREESARARRYLLGPEEMLRAEKTAQAAGEDVIAIFHSHPDHPNHPSEFDREWALPWLIYLITTVQQRKAGETKAWRLSEDRSQFLEETLVIADIQEKIE